MKRLVLFIFVVHLLSSCANIIPPSGGDKDTLAATVVQSRPENGSVNVTGGQVELEFSEEIDASKLESELDVVPRYKGELKIISKKKNVIIRFLEPLDSNTTYTLNFGNGITDITERNVSKGLSYSFSTGPTIDSLSYSGKIDWLPASGKDAKTMVGLYPAADTANPFTSKPYYYTYAPNNTFNLHHLKEGQYKVYAWVDKNDDGIFEPQNETGGYRKENLQLNGNITRDTLIIYPSKNALPTVLSCRYLSSINTIKLNKSVEDYEILNKDKNVLNGFGPTQREIVFYSNGTIKDSLKLDLSLTDSSGQKNTEQITLYFEENYPGERENKSIQKSQLSTDIQYFGDKPKLIIKTDNPIFNIDTQLVKITQKGKAVAWEMTDIEFKNKNKTLIINKLNVKFGDSIVINFINNYNPRPYNNKKDTLQTRYLIKTKEMLAGLGIKLITNEKNYIIQIINKEGKIVISEQNPVALKFNSFEPGIYTMRAIIDTNGNGRWDTGEVLNHVEPENVLYYKETINLKPNWEIWDIQFKF